MIDTNAEIINLCVTSTATSLHVLVAHRVYQGLLPRGYLITNPAITFNARGGASNTYIPLIELSVGFQCWGNSAVIANQVARALSDYLLSDAVRTVSDDILAVKEESFGTPRIDPDVGWDSVLSYYNFIFKK